MFKKYIPLLAFLLWGQCFMPLQPVSAAGETLNVVTTTTIFADLVKQIGGERVEVKAVASPKQNIHFYSPKPSDVRAVASADLYVNVGLDLEAWSDPLLEAAGKPELMRGRNRNLDLSKGIALLHVPTGNISRSEGDIHLFGNPHYTMNPENFKIMAKSVAEKLAEIDPSGAASYQENEKQFLSQLDAKLQEWKSLCQHCQDKEIISYHEDIAYFAQFVGLKAEQFIEPKPGIPPGPRHLAELADYAVQHPVGAIVLPTYYSRATAEKLAERIGTRSVTIVQNAGEVAGSEGVVGFFDYNFRQISEALK
ncbi:MAG: zinc ABC transporter substrate-binding protein [Candidatus Omnitrophica bacterium]|nr:zinc ABC transporter substrate-binding protein [Candidatus Omnitrophota bacterium]